MDLCRQRGFTLIEILIVITIIAILAAIALPQFNKYRMKGYHASSLTDLRNARTLQESLYTSFQRYGRTAAAALPGPGGGGAGIVVAGPENPATPDILTLFDEANNPRGIITPLGNGVTLLMSTDADEVTYTAVAKHLLGAITYAIDSDAAMIYQNGDLHGESIGVQPGDEKTPAPSTDQFAGQPGWSVL